MRSIFGLIIVACGVISACSPAADSTARFDAAVDAMSVAYFHHVPEAATQLGVPDELVPNTSIRMMDRSPDGNASTPLPFIESTVRDWIEVSGNL